MQEVIFHYEVVFNSFNFENLLVVNKIDFNFKEEGNMNFGEIIKVINLTYLVKVLIMRIKRVDFDKKVLDEDIVIKKDLHPVR